VLKHTYVLTDFQQESQCVELCPSLQLCVDRAVYKSTTTRTWWTSEATAIILL